MHVAAAGAWCVRVHDVVATVDALDVVAALRTSRPETDAMSGGIARDRIRLSGVRGRGFHGVFDHEQRDGQEFVVDVELEVDLAPAGASDDLADTVNYAEIGADVVARIEGEPLDLIERLAERHRARTRCAHRRSTRSTVTVHKPQAPVGCPFADVDRHGRAAPCAVPVVVAVGANLPRRRAATAGHRPGRRRGARAGIPTSPSSRSPS